MLKRYWPLLTLVIIVILAAIILPATVSLMPKVADSRYDANFYPTEISIGTSLINFPADVQAGEPFEVSGYLLYKAREYTNQNGETVIRGWISPTDTSLSSSYREVALPLSFKKVIISFNWTGSDQELFTDEKGYFQTTVQLNKKPDWPLSIHAEYLGEEIITNYPRNAKLPLKTVYLSDAITIPRKENPIDRIGGITDLSSVISIASIVFALIFIIIIGYFVFRYRKQLAAWLKKRKAKVRQIVPSLIEETIPTQTEANWEGDSRIEIVFPQIENPLPPVWGVGEPLIITGRVNAENTQGDDISVPQIKASALNLDIAISGFTPVRLEHTFADKGKAAVSITYSSGTDTKKSASRSIKIVDYREEIVALFNGLIDTLSAKGVAVDRTMTAREIETKLSKKYPSLTADAIADIVRGFEFANYSLRPVPRQVYVEMYLAINKIREKLNAV